MPNFRIYYVEREVAGQDARTLLNAAYGSAGGGMVDSEGMTETEWEETYEGTNAPDAMDAFFKDHATEREVRLLEEDGTARDVGSDEEWDPDRTYVWIESEKLMEYQGLDEATEGMVACPLCDATGEVDEAVAEEFLASYSAPDKE